MTKTVNAKVPTGQAVQLTVDYRTSVRSFSYHSQSPRWFVDLVQQHEAANPMHTDGLHIHNGNRYMIAHEYDWIIRAPTGAIVVLNSDQFHQLYNEQEPNA